MIEAVNKMELLRNYYSIYSTIHNDVKDIIKSGNYEKIILDLMNASKEIFPSRYTHLNNQAHGECDFVEDIHARITSSRVILPSSMAMMRSA